jgi:VanZ family protein
MIPTPELKRNLFFRFPVFLYMAILYGLSSLPGIPIDLPSLPHLDKVLHALAYAGLGMVLARLFRSSPAPALAGNPIFWVILTGTLYGISDELHQTCVPGRDASVFDVVADAFGCAVAALLYRPAVYPHTWQDASPRRKQGEDRS